MLRLIQIISVSQAGIIMNGNFFKCHLFLKWRVFDFKKAYNSAHAQIINDWYCKNARLCKHTSWWTDYC